MVRGAFVVVASLVVLGLAGCSSRAGQDNTPNPTPAQQTVVTGDKPAEKAPPVVGPCTITRTAANTALGYGVNPDKLTGQKTDCAFSEADTGNLSRFHYAVLEVAWQAQTTETSIGLMVHATCQGGDQGTLPGGQCKLGQVVGKSAPLRLVLYPDVMDRYAAADPILAVFTEGASVQHTFDLRISLFEQGPVGDDYTGFTLLQ
jgi:hypothetical protein